MDFLDIREYATSYPQVAGNFQQTPTIPIIVGQDNNRTTFYVHKVLLTSHTDYFGRALMSNFTEGQEQICRFPEGNQYAFHLLVQWLYRGEYEVTSAMPEAFGGNQQIWFKFHAHAYVLGNMLVARVCHIAFFYLRI